MIDSEEHWMVNNKETIQNAILSQCGKTLPVQEKGIIAGFHSVGSENDHHPNAPTYEAVCINVGLNIVRNSDELQHVNCTQVFTRSAGYTKNKKDTLFKTQILQELQREFSA